MCQLNKPIAKLLTACKRTKSAAPALYVELAKALQFANKARECEKLGPAFNMARGVACFMALRHIKSARYVA